jgi:glycosyltransferase 2 family protein
MRERRSPLSATQPHLDSARSRLRRRRSSRQFPLDRPQCLMKWSLTKKVRFSVCLLVSSVCLFLAVRGMNAEQALQELLKSSPLPIVGAVLFLFLSIWIRAWRWGYLLLPIKSISPFPLFRSTLIGFMGNNLLPFRAGELLRGVSIGQSQNISKGAALGSIILERAFDGVVLSLIPFLLLAFLDLAPWVVAASLALFLVYLTGLFLIMFTSIGEWAGGCWRRATTMMPPATAEGLGSIAEHFFQGMKGSNQFGSLLTVSLLSFLCWLCNGMYFFLLFEALGIKLSFLAALIVQVVIALGAMLPAGPGDVGSFEYLTVLGLALFGISQEAAFAYALLAHICQFVPITAAGLFFGFRAASNQIWN